MFRTGTIVVGRKIADRYGVTKAGVKVRVTNRHAEDGNDENLNVEILEGYFKGRVFNVDAARFRRVNGHGN